MKYAEAKQGRVFVIRLEDGEILHEEIEKFAKQHAISAGFLTVVGGADVNSELIVGPETPRDIPVKPVSLKLENVHEVSGVGTLFPDDLGNPTLHMHMACGHQKATITGCVRKGVRTWHILEVILVELLDVECRRMPNPEMGFKLLDM